MKRSPTILKTAAPRSATKSLSANRLPRRIRAACHHVALLTPEALLRVGLTPASKVLDLNGRLRCRGWAEITETLVKRRSELDHPEFGPIWRERSDCPDRPRLAVEHNTISRRLVMANTREHRYSVSVIWNGNLGGGALG